MERRLERDGRILITGATGFVGSHVLDAFARGGAPVRALVRPTTPAAGLDDRGIEVVRGALDSPETLAPAVEGADVVVHLAAVTHARSDAEFRRVNEEGTRSLLDAMRAARVRPRRLVFLSSLAAVGPCTAGEPAGRATVPRPLTGYGRSKLAAERICLEAADDMEVVVLRAPAVYGPRDRDLFIYFRLARLGLLPVPSGPDRLVQLVHAADLARAVVRAASVEGVAGVYHVAEPRAYAWREVARLIAAAVGRRGRMVPLPPAVVRAAGAASELGAALLGRSTIFNRDKVRELLANGWLCETDTARLELGFDTTVALPDGLTRTARWYREHGWL